MNAGAEITLSVHCFEVYTGIMARQSQRKGGKRISGTCRTLGNVFWWTNCCGYKIRPQT